MRAPHFMGEQRPSATWWWHDGPVDAPTLRFLHEQQVERIFWSLPWDEPDEADRNGIATLRRSGIRVDGLGGDGSWAVEPALAEQWAHRVLADGTVTELHLDIEPWADTSLPAPLPVLLEGAAEAVRRVAALCPVEIDVAPWIADRHPAEFAALCSAAQRVTLLAYRDRASSVASLSATARASLAALGRPFRIAVETAPAMEPHITFADDGRQVLDRELIRLRQTSNGDPWCLGLAVHDLEHWRSLPR